MNPKIREKGKAELVRRFSLARIAEHWIHAVLFCLLVVTGLSQKFATLDVSQSMIAIMGGIDQTRFLHRVFAVVFSGAVLMHVGVGITAIMTGRWLPTMMITAQDFRDTVRNIRYSLGMEQHQARGDRYTHQQKCVYWAVLSSAVAMMATGLVLWFPMASVRIFPGEIIPAAKLVHSNQGLLVFLLVSIWHIYNVVFSPDVFPLDTSMFSGAVSRKIMLERHPLEFARLEGRGGKKPALTPGARKQSVGC